MHNSQGGWMELDPTQFAVLIFCDESTDCGEMGDNFAADADTMINIVCEADVNEDLF